MNIGSISSGRLSAIMCEKLFLKFDVSDIELIFMDTLIEDSDNYRFLNELETRWKSIYGFQRIVRLTEGRTPYEVSHAEHVIPNSRVAPCTRRLKIEPFTKYLKGKYLDEQLTIHIGYDFSEVHRCESTTKNYAKYGWSVDYPMLWEPIEYRDYSTILREWGIEAPRMYMLGYSHANCGGECVKQGVGDWIKTLINFPDRYYRSENWERKMRENPINADYTILKRMKNGKGEKITLEQLRKEYESKNKNMMFSSEDFVCVRCGVGDLVE